MNIPYKIEALVVEGGNLIHGKIKKRVRVWAMLMPDGREVVITQRYPGGLHPGVYSGGLPILKESDLKPWNIGIFNG